MCRILAGLSVTALLVCAPVASAWSQGLDSLTSWWNEGRYDDVVVPLIRIRDSIPGETRLKVDYMIATSLCRGSRAQFRAKGLEFYDAILARYRRQLGTEGAKAITEERVKCQQAAAAAGGAGPVAGTPIALAVAPPTAEIKVGGGKEFPDFCSTSPSASVPLKVVRVVPQDELAARVFALGHQSDAMTSIRRALRPTGFTYSFDTVGHFLLATASGQTPAELREIGTLLERYARFYSARYMLPLADSLLTAVLVGSPSQLRTVATALHGISPADAVIGYSVLSDLTLVAVIPYRAQGTLAHELMHVMLRGAYPEVPSWLDEGLAALYEVSQVQADTVVGLPNWRGQVLRRLWIDLPRDPAYPTLEALLGMDSELFQRADLNYDVTAQAVNYALARYFVLYLQERGALADVVARMRARAVIAFDPGTEEITILRDDGGAQLALIAG